MDNEVSKVIDGLCIAINSHLENKDYDMAIALVNALAGLISANAL